MIYKSDKKSILCKGDFRPVQLYKGNKKYAGYEMTSFEGQREAFVSDSYSDRLYNVKIHGNCVQEGEPSPENPIDVLCVGDLVSDGEHAGKYKVTVVAHNDNFAEGFDIYLSEPLRKVGEYEDYIDFANKKVIRNLQRRILNGTETWYRENFRLYTSNGSLSAIESAKISCISNRFKGYSWTELYKNSYLTNKKIGIAQQIKAVNITPAQTIPTVEEWKAQLAAWNDEGNPLEVIFVNTVREEIIDLPEIPTFSGTTYYEIVTDIGAGISGEYKRVEV